MARSKYTFEKRQKEKAKRQKQIEKSAQRMMAKKAKAASEAGTTGEDDGAIGLSTDAPPLPENGDKKDRE